MQHNKPINPLYPSSRAHQLQVTLCLLSSSVHTGSKNLRNWAPAMSEVFLENSETVFLPALSGDPHLPLPSAKCPTSSSSSAALYPPVDTTPTLQVLLEGTQNPHPETALAPLLLHLGTSLLLFTVHFFFFFVFSVPIAIPNHLLYPAQPYCTSGFLTVTQE